MKSELLDEPSLLARLRLGSNLRKDQLRLKSVTKPTLKRCIESVHQFKLWARASRRSLATHEAVDKAMCIFLLELYYDGAHIWEGTYTVYGYQFLYNRGADATYLTGAKKGLKAFRRRQPSQMRKPQFLRR